MDEIIYKEAKDSARATKGKSYEERIGTLFVNFEGMDMVSARALILLVDLESK